MKELEKTKRISTSAILFLLIIIIGVLTFKKPKFVFDKNSETTLNKVVTHDYILHINNLDTLKSYTLIDIRSNYEYAKGHFKDAINISTHDVFSDNSVALLKQLKDDNQTVVLYGKNPDQANSAWMLLYQLGYDNIKILCVETNFINNKFEIKDIALEKPAVNFAEVMQSSIGDKSVVSETKKPKKVVPLPKKKKRVAEGGC